MVLVSHNFRWWFGWRGPLFHSLVWRGRFCHYVWVGSLDGAVFESFTLGCWFGGAACFIKFGLVVWRGPLFPFSLGCWFGGAV